MAKQNLTLQMIDSLILGDLTSNGPAPMRTVAGRIKAEGVGLMTINARLAVLVALGRAHEAGAGRWHVFATSPEAAQQEYERRKSETPGLPSEADRVAKAVAAGAISKAEGDAYLAMRARLVPARAKKVEVEVEAAPAPPPPAPAQNGGAKPALSLPGVKAQPAKGGAPARR